MGAPLFGCQPQVEIDEIIALFRRRPASQGLDPIVGVHGDVDLAFHIHVAQNDHVLPSQQAIAKHVVR
ncbi:MAG: hypothetical protein ACK56I_24195, partial [bacterium]